MLVMTSSNEPVRSLENRCCENIVIAKYIHRETDLKPGLHIVVVRVAEHDSGDVSKRILTPSIYRSQIFLSRDQYLLSLLPHGDQAIAGQIEKHVLEPMLAILTTYMETRLKKFKLSS